MRRILDALQLMAVFTAIMYIPWIAREYWKIKKTLRSIGGYGNNVSIRPKTGGD